MTSSVAARPAINWPAAIVLTATFFAALTVIPVYAFNFDFSTSAWVSFIVLLTFNGMSITGGYHRLWAHRAYEAHWSLKIFFMLFGAMAIQNSILIWASSHRTHHRNVDDVDGDPYSINRGFFFAHIGWMLRNYESGKPNFSNANDLLNDKIVMFQHNYYVPIVLVMNLGLPIALGLLLGDFWGVFLLGGLLRLVVSHHVTFFINSLCHMWGTRPYTDENTARDNPVLALMTWGEGYHNYHHIFQYDYRNGVKWWQFDPTKWMILSLSWVGITRNLKRCSEFAIQKAQLTMQFKRAEQQLAKRQARKANVEALKAKVAHEYEIFSAAMQEWAKVKEEEFAQKKAQLQQKWEDAPFRARFKEIESRLKEQRKRMRALTAQVASA
ncbi:MAG: acyl-CoA desaturase [Moraxellaceae bacterium]|jgi:stearoyl-CoA desaturase (delta-9 desaturase)|nr:acyl-CoA desaturase [Moraxellaceae bacterium]